MADGGHNDREAEPDSAVMGDAGLDAASTLDAAAEGGTNDAAATPDADAEGGTNVDAGDFDPQADPYAGLDCESALFSNAQSLRMRALGCVDWAHEWRYSLCDEIDDGTATWCGTYDWKDHKNLGSVARDTDDPNVWTLLHHNQEVGYIHFRGRTDAGHAIYEFVGDGVSGVCGVEGITSGKTHICK